LFRYHTAYESLRRERMKLGVELFRYVRGLSGKENACQMRLEQWHF
jgi:hypothetical protein